MGQLIYAFLYTVDPQSKVAKEHPDWVCMRSRSTSRHARHVEAGGRRVHEGTVGRLPQALGRFRVAQRQLSDRPAQRRRHVPARARTPDFARSFAISSTSIPAARFKASTAAATTPATITPDTPRRFRSATARSAFSATTTHRCCFRPTSRATFPIVWNPDNYDKATWRGLLCINFDMTGDTWDRAKLEGIRELIDIYHYLHRRASWDAGCASIGRSSPATIRRCISSGSAAIGGAGIIILKRPAPGAVTIQPKGLLPDGELHRLVPRIGCDATADGRRPDGTRDHHREDAARRIDLSESAAPPGQQARQGTAHRAERREEAGGREHGLSGRRTDLEAGAPTTTGSPTTRCSATAWPSTAWPRASTTSIIRPAPIRPPSMKFGRSTGRATCRQGRWPPVPRPSRRSVVDDAPGGGVAYTGAWQSKSGLLPASLRNAHDVEPEGGDGHGCRSTASGCFGSPNSAPTPARRPSASTAVPPRSSTRIRPTTSGAFACFARSSPPPARTRFESPFSASTARERPIRR